MGDITQDLWATGGGSVSVATDEMLADLESLRALSTILVAVRTQLAIADATFTEQARGMTQVTWARSSMDHAWATMTEAASLADFVTTGLVSAIDNYTEAELNAAWMAGGVDAALSFLLGSAVSLTPGIRHWLATQFPGLIASGFAADSEAIEATDVEVDGGLNALLLDPATVAMIRRLAMTGELFAVGAGVPHDVIANLESMGLSGAGLSAGLIMLYAQQAGMLIETDVKVSKSISTEPRNGPAVASTEKRLEAIPDPAKRADGAQIRVDEIHDGSEVRYEVFVAGTADFNPISKNQPFDFTSNVAGVAGQSAASYRAVEEAMRQAGITADSAVSFVGYSQGGLVATLLAASGDYNTKGLTTIGAPAGQVIVPAGVPALIIEHYEDIVPALGGTQANTDAVVVRRHAFSESHPADTSLPMPGHQLQYYLQTATQIDSAESALTTPANTQ